MVAKTKRNWLGFVTLFLLGIGVMASPGRAANISSCQTIGAPGNYTLTHDLKVTAITTNSPNCLVISHSNVAIDLNGYKITGLGNATGAGITEDGNARSQIIIANGKIQGFGTGIMLSNFITIARMSVVQNTGNGISIDSYGAVTDTRANDNGQDGIHVNDLLVTVTDSEANNNGGNGMYLGGDNNVVNNSEANKNGGNGMYFGHNNEVVSNKIGRGGPRSRDF
jgi:hypothetical protein